MSQNQYNPGILSVALITVSVEEVMADRIADEVCRLSWAVHRADCEGYISASKRPPFPQLVKSSHACIAIIDFDNDIDQAIAAAAYIQELFLGKAALVGLSVSQDPDVLLRAMRAGCTEFIVGRFDDSTFSQTLKRLHHQWSSKTVGSITRGKVVTLLGVKGGVGTTTVAVHLAMYLVQAHKKRTLLIDNHPQLGHACVYLGIDGSRYHFQELVRNLARLDSDLLRGYIAVHPSGLEVLSSPDVCGILKAVDPDAIAQTLEFLRGEYDYVILDCATSLNDSNLAVINASNHVYLLATPEIAAIRDLARYVDSLSQGEQTFEKIQVVINRSTAQHAVDIERIEKVIRVSVAIKLPNTFAELARASILGEPIASKQKSDFAGSLLDWATNLVGTAAPIQDDLPKRSIFSRWKKVEDSPAPPFLR